MVDSRNNWPYSACIATLHLHDACIAVINIGKSCLYTPTHNAWLSRQEEIFAHVNCPRDKVVEGIMTGTGSDVDRQNCNEVGNGMSQHEESLEWWESETETFPINHSLCFVKTFDRPHCVMVKSDKDNNEHIRVPIYK